MKVEQLRKLGVMVDRVTSYSDFDNFANIFLNGHKGHYYPFLIVIGGPGIGKSHHFETGKGCVYIAGDISAVGLYELAYRYKDKTLIFDDVDAMFANKAVAGLLRVLMNDREVKRLCWKKQNATFQTLGITSEFETRSRCCIIMNELPKAFGVRDKAILARGKFIVFEPTAQEVHAEAGRWFKEREIFDFIGQNLSLVTDHNFRWYTRALQEKKTGSDWRGWLLTQWQNNDENPYLPTIASILNAHEKTADQLEAWKERGFKRSLFFREKNRYLVQQGLDKKSKLNGTTGEQEQAKE